MTSTNFRLLIDKQKAENMKESFQIQNKSSQYPRNVKVIKMSYGSQDMNSFQLPTYKMNM